MANLALRLYAEGPTDERLLSKRGRGVADVLPVEPIDLTNVPRGLNRAERILEAARRAAGSHLLIIHADADRQSRSAVLQTRFKRGEDLVRRAHQEGQGVCDRLIPIIPVRMTEAWMLADSRALVAEVGEHPSRGLPNLPTNPRAIEAERDPKQVITTAIRQARSHHQVSLGEIYEPLARRLDLATLDRLPAFGIFVDDLTKALVDASFIV